MYDDREGQQYHVTLLGVRMRVKFPCKMKLEHQGSLITAQVPSSSKDNKYIFNQELVLKKQINQSDCFELVFHLVTDKGARYIGGVVKLYHSQMMRSQGEKLTLSLSKCVDTEAFCEIRVSKIVSLQGSRYAGQERRSSVQRNYPSFKPKDNDHLEVPFKNNYLLTNQQSKSEYNFPVYTSNNKHDDWDNRTKSRFAQPQIPTPPNHSRVRTPSKNIPSIYQQNIKIEERQGYNTRETAIQAQAYRQGYQKLKQKYRKQTEISKNELNKRLALEASENGMKLELMRMKMKIQQQDRIIQDKTSKMKELQQNMSNVRQKDGQNNYLKQEIEQKNALINELEEKIELLNNGILQLKDNSKSRNLQENYKLRQIKMQMENMKIVLDAKDKQLYQQSSRRKELTLQYQNQIARKTDQLQRAKRLINQLEKGVNNKNFDLEKAIQNERIALKQKHQQLKSKLDKLQKQNLKFAEERRQFQKKIQDYKSNVAKLQYQRKLAVQQCQLLQQQNGDSKSLRERLSQLQRQNKRLLQEKNEIQAQIDKIVQLKQSQVISLTRQLKEQSDYFKNIFKEMEEKQRRKNTEKTQVQSQLMQAKNTIEKQKKSIDNLSREVQECKQRQKNAKRAIKNKQSDSLGMETEHAALKQKLKTIDQIYKLEADKIRQQSEKYRIQLEDQARKTQDLIISHQRMTQQYSQIKTKLQYAQQRAEKDEKSLKEKQQQIQQFIRQSHQQQAESQKTIQHLKASQKELSSKLQKIQVQTLRREQKSEKTKRENRILQQKCNSLDTQLKAKISELQSIQQQKQFQAARLLQKQGQISQLRSVNGNLLGEKTRLSKINQIQEESIQSMKLQMEKNRLAAEGLQARINELQESNRQQAQQFIKLEMKYNSFKKQHERNKQNLYDSINKHVVQLANPQEDSSQKGSPKKSIEATVPQMIGLIVSHGKILKQTLSKNIQNNKLLQKEKQRLLQQITAAQSKAQSTQSELLRQMGQLQQQLNKLYDQKQVQSQNFTIIVNEMNEKVKQKEQMEQQLNTQIQQLNFTINSIKLDFQSINDQNSKRMSNLRKSNLQLQDKVENNLIAIAQLQDKNAYFASQLTSLQQQFTKMQENSSKQNKHLQEAIYFKENLEKEMDILQRKNKQLNERISDCELYLSTQREAKEKFKQELQKQEKSSLSMKSFIAELMKQKQAAIKSDLQKNQSITELQATFLEQSKSNQLLRQQNQRLVKTLQSLKDTNKKTTLSVKDYQYQLKENSNKLIKIQQKLREKQSQLLVKQQLLIKIESKLQKSNEKSKQQIKQLQQELQKMIQQLFDVKQLNCQKISQLQNQLLMKIQKIEQLSSKLDCSQQSLFIMNEKIVHLQQNVENHKQQCQQLRSKINLMDESINELSDEIKEREERLFQFSGKAYTLQLKYQSRQRQFNAQLQEINEQWSGKYQTMCLEYDQRLTLVEKQKNYYKQILQQRDREITKLNTNIKNAEGIEAKSHKQWEDKLKKLQDQKLATISAKNSELNKINEEYRTIAQNSKSKQSQLRRSMNELQMVKRALANQQIKVKEYEQKIKSQQNMYQNEITQLKRKEAINKSFRQNLSNHQWNSERETKRILQTFIRSFLQISEDKNSQKMVQMIRGLQSSLIDILSFNYQQK